MTNALFVADLDGTVAQSDRTISPVIQERFKRLGAQLPLDFMSKKSAALPDFSGGFPNVLRLRTAPSVPEPKI